KWPPVDATRRRFRICSRKKARLLQCVCSCCCHRVVVFDRTAAYADAAYYVTATVLQWYAARERDEATIAMFDVIERAAGLRKLPDLPSVHVEPTGRASLLKRNIDRKSTRRY